MKKWIMILSLVLFLGANLTPAIASGPGQDGPAPNSGDGEPDGSGFGEPDNGPNGDGEENGKEGPAPNSGDGDPDGSGF